MHRKLALVVAGVVGMVAFAGGLTAEDKSGCADPSISEIMKKINGKKGLVAKTGEAVKAEKWDDAEKLAKDIKELGEALGKNKPEKGEAASWEKLTKKYAKNTAAIAAAVEKKDGKAFGAATKAFGGACKECHDAHK